MLKETEVMLLQSKIQDRHVHVAFQWRSVAGNYGSPQESKWKTLLPIFQTGYA